MILSTVRKTKPNKGDQELELRKINEAFNTEALNGTYGINVLIGVSKKVFNLYERRYIDQTV